jgi:hypothetical protein
LGFTTGLFLKTTALNVRIVEFRVAGGDFLTVDNKLINVDY